MCSLSEYMLAELLMKQRAEQKTIGHHEIYTLRGVCKLLKLKIHTCISWFFSFHFQSLQYGCNCAPW